MPVTLHELAKAAGCSVSTVSRALTDSDHRVNDVTKERILALADQMGYHPNITARGLKTDRTFTIGLVVYNIASPFTPILIRGIQEYLKLHNYFSIIISTRFGTGTGKRSRAPADQPVHRWDHFRGIVA